MRTRILPVEEWQRMEDRDISKLLPFVEPDNLDLIVVEDDSGEIVASVAVMRVTHFEGLWIRGDHRGNAGVFRSLIRAAYKIPEAWNERWVIGGAGRNDERMKTLCQRLGGHQLPIEFYTMPVTREN